MNKRSITLRCCLGLGFLLPAGCWSASGPEIVVYTALDREFSESVFRDFRDQSGIAVRAKFDTESTKTVGLAQAIIAEADRPRCDVFWNNEILNTLRLEKMGLLEVYQSPMGKNYPARYRSPGGTWYGFAARARVILVNTKLVEADRMPRSIYDLADPKYKGRTGIAKPLFGTTATHATCLFERLGPSKAKEFFRKLKANEVQILAGNKTAARSVSAGQLAFCLTDTDDAILEIDAGHPVAIIYPDQYPGGMGTLFIPNTLAIIKGSPNREHAAKLIEYLLSPQVEARLARGPSAQIPLHPDVKEKPRGNIATPASIRAMQIDFGKAAEHWDETAEFLRQEFASGG